MVHHHPRRCQHRGQHCSQEMAGRWRPTRRRQTREQTIWRLTAISHLCLHGQNGEELQGLGLSVPTKAVPASSKTSRTTRASKRAAVNQKPVNFRRQTRWRQTRWRPTRRRQTRKQTIWRLTAISHVCQ